MIVSKLLACCATNALRSVAETSGLSASSALTCGSTWSTAAPSVEPDEAEQRLRYAEVRGRRGRQQDAAGQRRRSAYVAATV